MTYGIRVEFYPDGAIVTERQNYHAWIMVLIPFAQAKINYRNLLAVDWPGSELTPKNWIVV